MQTSHAPHRCRRRPFRDPALEPADQLGGLLLVEQAADRGHWHERCGLAVEFVAVRKIRTLVDPLYGSAHPRMNQMREIDDDDADEATAGFVREPETRHTGNL
jgi:hypothetical protein